MALALLLAALLAAPVAAGATPTGTFATQGELNLPSGAILSLSGWAAGFLPETTDIALTLTATGVRICERELTAAEAATVRVPYNPNGGRGCVNLASATIQTIPGNNTGWVGLRTSSVVHFVPAVDTPVSPRAFTVLATRDAEGASVNSQDREDQPGFINRTTTSHLFLKSSGLLSLSGAAHLKLMGPDFSVESDEGRATYRTGEVVSATGPLSERRWRWIVIDFQSGTLEIHGGDASFQIVASDASAEWEGSASFVAASGVIVDAKGRTHELEPGASVAVEGHLTALLEPEPSSRGIAGRLYGDVRGVTMGEALVPSRTVSQTDPWRWILAGIGLTAAAGVTVYLIRRAPPPENLRESYAKRAEDAADAGHFDIALDLILRARVEDPTDGELTAKHAMILLKLGRIKDAMGAFDVASYRLKDGTAERMAAICAVRLGDYGRAQFYVLRAISRATNRAQLDRLAEVEELHPILDQELVRQEMESARRRLARGTPF